MRDFLDIVLSWTVSRLVPAISPIATFSRLLQNKIFKTSVFPQVESLYPEKMGPANMPLDEFLAKGLPLLDEAIQKRIESAASNGNVLRYVCLIEESRYLLITYLVLLPHKEEIYKLINALIISYCLLLVSSWFYPCQNNL